MGYAVAGSSLAGVLNGCKADTSTGWKPAFFSELQLLDIAEIAETILPKTDTPGAKDVQVERFVDAMLHEFLSSAEQKHFMNGYKAFSTLCKQSTGKTFADCTEQERIAILKQQESVSPAIISSDLFFTKSPKPSFYRKLKELSILGYFTSEEIGKNVLSYDPIPQKYIPCLPESEVGNVWAL